MAYRSRLKIRFGDEDHAGIVYYPRFFDYFHRVFEDFFAEEGGRTYQQVLDEDGYGWPSAHAEADFAEPLRFGDVLELELVVEHVGTKSATFAYRGTRVADGKDIVRGKVTVVCVAMGTLKAQPIPDFYRQLFLRHRSG